MFRLGNPPSAVVLLTHVAGSAGGRALGARGIRITPAAAVSGGGAEEQRVAARSTLLFRLEGLVDLDTGAVVDDATVQLAVVDLAGAGPVPGLGAVALQPAPTVPGDYRVAAAAAATLTPGLLYTAVATVTLGTDVLEVRARFRVGDFYGAE